MRLALRLSTSIASQLFLGVISPRLYVLRKGRAILMQFELFTHMFHLLFWNIRYIVPTILDKTILSMVPATNAIIPKAVRGIFTVLATDCNADVNGGKNTTAPKHVSANKRTRDSITMNANNAK